MIYLHWHMLALRHEQTYYGRMPSPALWSSGLSQGLVLGGRTTSENLQESWMEKFLHKFIVHPINSFKTLPS